MFRSLVTRRGKTHAYLRVLYLSNFILRLAFGFVLLTLPFYVIPDPRFKDNTLLQVAIIAVPYPFAEMLTANWFGSISDKLGRKRVIVSGSVWAMLMVLLYPFTQDTILLAVIHGLHGIGAAATVAPSIAMIADYAGPEDRGRQMGFYDYSTFAGYIIGAVFAGALIALFEGFGYGQLQAVRLTFYPVALFLGLSAIILQMYVRKERVTAVRAKLFDFRDLREVLKVREIGVLLPVWLIISTILGIALTYLPRVLFEAKVGALDIALLFGGVGLALLLLQPLWGKISDIVGRVPVMFYGILSILGVLVMAALFWDRILARDPLFLAPVGLFALGSGAFVPSALALMADTAPETKYGATMGLYSFALGFGFFVAELSGLSIIAASSSSLPPNPSVEQVRAAIGGALQGLFYFSLILITLAVLLMVRFFVIGRKKEREAAAAVEQLRNDPR
ncbi:MAG: MFS transporter [Methanobacteriota archaeon]|nr:MAG: MFS transporter [Euryarchaeota archaeon]